MLGIVIMLSDMPNTKLIGKESGRALWEEVKYKYKDLSQYDQISIVFPEDVSRVSSSFIEGFFSDIVRQVGISGIQERFRFIAPSMKGMDIKEFILKCLQ